MEIQYTAPAGVRAVIETLGRTEDVRFSPGNRRLAVAAFNRNTIAVFDVDIAASPAVADVALTRVVEISSACLSRPHGLDFIDDETLVAASRDGDVAIFKLPPGESAGRRCELSPIQVLKAGEPGLLKSPGSVAVTGRGEALRELLICNNAGHSVTRHVMDCSAGCSVTSSEVLLGKWLDVPDGVCMSHDRRWIAVSNHNTHNVLLYENAPSLHPQSDPDGVLRSVCYPHGLRFGADGRHIFVADAGAPYIHIYANDGQGWRGARGPAASVRIMDESVFLRGRNNPQEGGPKGIDIDRGMNVLVATSEHQPLAFFDLTAILAKVPAGAQVLDVRYELGLLEQAGWIRDRLNQAETRAAEAEARLARAKNRKPWSVRSALRRVRSALGA